MKVVLFNLFHAGDIVMSRAIIKDILAANPEHEFVLQCRHTYTYLWEDLGAPVVALADGSIPVGDGHKLNLWFACFPDMLSRGLTYLNHIETYGRQAKKFGLAAVEDDGKQRFVDLPRVEIPPVAPRSVLVENGPVLSGQPVLDIDTHLEKLARQFSNVTFYCSGKRKVRGPRNIVDVSSWNLLQLSMLSEQCTTMIARLSAIMVCSFTKANHGRRRIVFGSPLGCPIWDEAGLVYVSDYTGLKDQIASMVR